MNQGVRGLMIALMFCLVACHAPEPTIEQSPYDNRHMKHLRWHNGMQILIVQDPEAQNTSAALAVGAGSHHEPKQWPGLAHLLEHMLFLGTDHHPEADAFMNLVQRHGGQHNAATHPHQTRYFFEVPPEHAPEVMALWQEFFTQPALNPQWLAKEIQAVDAEYHMRRTREEVRLDHALKTQWDPEHPISRFHVGNRSVFEADPSALKEALRSFFDTHYTPDRMSLVVISPEPVADTLAWLAPLWQEAGSKAAGVDRRSSTWPALTLRQEEDLLIRIPQEESTMHWSLQLPIQHQGQRHVAQHAAFLAFALGVAWEGGVIQLWKERGDVLATQAGLGYLDADHSTVGIRVSLSEQGQAHQERLEQEVVGYIAALAQHPQLMAYHELWKQHRHDLWLRAEHASSMHQAGQWAGALLLDPPTHLLRGLSPSLWERCDEAELRAWLLDRAASQRVLQTSATQTSWPNKEPFYQTPYSVTWRALAQRPEPAVWTAEWSLPPEHPQGTRHLALGMPSPCPQALQHDRISLWWHAGVPGMRRPQVNTHMLLRHHADTLERWIVASLWAHDFAQAEEGARDALALQHAHWRLHNHASGWILEAEGERDGYERWFAEVLARFQAWRFTPERWARAKEHLKAQEAAWAQASPVQQAQHLWMLHTAQNQWPEEEQARALEALTLARAEALQTTMRQELSAMALVEGNVSGSQTQAWAHTWADALALSHCEPHQAPQARQWPEGHAANLAPYTHTQDRVVLGFYPWPEEGVSGRMQAAVLASLLKGPFFHELRTQKQLGYHVALHPVSLHGQQGIMCYVQSPHASSEELQQHIQTFWKHHMTALFDKNAGYWKPHLEALRHQLSLPEHDLATHAERHWDALLQHEGDFGRRQEAQRWLDHRLQDAHNPPWGAVDPSTGPWFWVRSAP